MNENQRTSSRIRRLLMAGGLFCALAVGAGWTSQVALAGPPTGLVGTASELVTVLLPFDLPPVPFIKTNGNCAEQKSGWYNDGWNDTGTADGRWSGSGASFSADAAAGGERGTSTSRFHSRAYPDPVTFGSPDNVGIQWDQSGSGSAGWGHSGGGGQTQNSASASAVDGAELWSYNPDTNTWNTDASGNQAVAISPAQPGTVNGVATTRWSGTETVDASHAYTGLFFGAAMASAGDSTASSTAHIAITAQDIYWCTSN